MRGWSGRRRGLRGSDRLLRCSAGAGPGRRGSRVRKSESAEGIDQAGIHGQSFAFDDPGVGGHRDIRADGVNESIAQNHCALWNHRTTHRNHACVAYRDSARRKGAANIAPAITESKRGSRFIGNRLLW